MRHEVYLIGLAIHLVVVAFLAVRVVSRGLPIANTLSWVLVLFLFPYFGPFLYLMIAENKMGTTRSNRARALLQPMEDWFHVLANRNPVDWRAMPTTVANSGHISRLVPAWPATSGNEINLYVDALEALAALRDEIKQAKHSVHLLFYIWNEGGLSEEVARELILAKQRGVSCRVLLDDVGSRPFLKSALAQDMRDAGIELASALPVHLLRAWFQRIDLRNHRKIAVIDGNVGFTGSLNLADPRFFKQEENVGEWVDTMIRLEGPIVDALNLLFLRDWQMETGTPVEELKQNKSPDQRHPGNCVMQLVPSGPDIVTNTIHDILLALIYSAREEIILTSPYFVPTEPLLRALAAASGCGVKVTLIIPEKIDSWLVQQASDSTFETLSAAGVKIARFQAGLLHSKTMTIDSSVSLIGSVNMDMRSFFINFEVSCLVWDAAFTARLRALQSTYLARSALLVAENWNERTRRKKTTEALVRLASPLL